MTDIITKWVAALRSGIYKQRRGRLCANYEYCCLGVLCDIIDSTKWVKSLFSQECWWYGYTRSIPPEALEKVGLSHLDQDALMILNDKVGLSFTAIADHIEKGYLPCQK